MRTVLALYVLLICMSPTSWCKESEVLVAAGPARGGFLSTDNGRTWVASGLNSRPEYFRTVSPSPSRFLGVGARASISTSLSPLTWQDLPPIPGPPISTVAYGRHRFVAVQGGTLLWCEDAPKIERLTPGERLPFAATEGAEIRPIASAFGDTEAGACFAVIGEADLPGKGEHIPWRGVSADGTHWEWSATGTLPARGLVYGNGIFVAVGPGGSVETSHDGQTWTKRESGTTEDLLAVHWDGERFLASGRHLFTSPDGMTWKAEAGIELPRPLLWAGPKLAFSTDWQGRLTRTTDFRTWTPVTPPGVGPITAVARLAPKE